MIRAQPVSNQIESRMSYTDMLPTEKHYRPRRTRRIGGGFFFVLAMMTAFMFSAPAWMLAGMVCTYVIFLGATREGAAAVSKNQNAIELLNSGNLHDAAREFEQLSRTEVKQSAHAVYVFNRAVTYMLEARLKKAMSLFNAVYHSRTFDRGPNGGYEPYLHAEMATCLGLMGMTNEAKTHREYAKRTLHASEQFRMVFADSVIALRRRDPKAALWVMDQNWDTAFEQLRPPSFRGLMVLRAFALYLDGDTGSQYEGLVRATKPTRPGEFDYLGIQWPEMRKFLKMNRRYGGVPRV